jgi:signal transduction histidine kinase
MGRLFWRMFLGLWFGSTLLMVGTSLLIVSTVERSMPPVARTSIERFVSATVRSVLSLYEKGGPAAAAEVLGDVERKHSVRIYFLDGAGREILGRKFPAAAAASNSVGSARGDYEFASSRYGESEYLFQGDIRTPAGGDYRAIVLLPGLTPPPHSFLLRSVWWPMLLSILAAGLISGFAAHHLVDPISKLQSAARRLASGELEYRIGHALRARKDEFTALGHDFDRMADQIGQLLGAQRLLMQDLSHELRSPLARIKVALELARSQSSPGALIDHMDRDADRMDLLIGELLLLARLESSNLHQQREIFDVSELTANIVDDARLEGANSGHRLHALIAPGLSVSGSRELMRRAIENVIRNALRHTPAGTGIEVLVCRAQDRAMIQVSDEGPGIAADSIDAMFVPFTRGEDASKDGNGLGLAITRAAVLQHGGRVLVANRENRSGLQVTVFLPLV